MEELVRRACHEVAKEDFQVTEELVNAINTALVEYEPLVVALAMMLIAENDDSGTTTITITGEQFNAFVINMLTDDQATIRFQKGV